MMVKETANTFVSWVLIAVFVFIGIVGVILPILPGIPFLLIAAIMASRHIPALDAYLQENRYTAKHMRASNRFGRLSFWGKVQVCWWGLLKVTVDTVEWCVSACAKLFGRKRAGVDRRIS